jgi:hypothetical protein
MANPGGGGGVLSSAKIAVQQFVSYSRPRASQFRFWFALFLAIYAMVPLAFSTDSNSFEEAVRQLADHVAAIPGLRGPVRLEMQPNAKSTAAEDTVVLETLRRELDKRRLSVTQDASALLLRVAAVQTPTQLVMTVSARIANTQEVRIVAVPRATLLAASLPVAPIRVDRQMIYESPERILDASSLWNGAEGGLAILTYRDADLTAARIDPAGALKQSVSLAAANLRASRDPHAELAPNGGNAEVLLPGKICEFSWTAASEPKCHATKPAVQEWRSATLLTSPCDGSAWKLVADEGDWTAAELLQIVPEDSTRKGSAVVLSEFPGPILSMNGEQNPNSALVVTRNLRTGNYEVYKVTLACGN